MHWCFINDTFHRNMCDLSLRSSNREEPSEDQRFLTTLIFIHIDVNYLFFNRPGNGQQRIQLLVNYICSTHIWSKLVVIILLQAELNLF